MGSMLLLFDGFVKWDRGMTRRHRVLLSTHAAAWFTLFLTEDQAYTQVQPYIKVFLWISYAEEAIPRRSEQDFIVLGVI
jgi:hypothetical protein